MKTAIFQYYIGKLPPWAQISIDRFKKYANIVGADYYFADFTKFAKNHYFENLRVVYDDMFSKYDRVLYVDVDVIVENFNENIFDCKIEDVGMIPEYFADGMTSPPVFMTSRFVEIWKGLTQNHPAMILMFNIPFVKPRTVKAEYLMFNSGVILWSREGVEKARSTFSPWSIWNKIWNEVLGEETMMSLDQPYITAQVVKNLCYTELPLKWNCFPRFRFHEDQIPSEINFIHYTGGKKKYITELYSNEN